MHFVDIDFIAHGAFTMSLDHLHTVLSLIYAYMLGRLRDDPSEAAKIEQSSEVRSLQAQLTDSLFSVARLMRVWDSILFLFDAVYFVSMMALHMSPVCFRPIHPGLCTVYCIFVELRSHGIVAHATVLCSQDNTPFAHRIKNAGRRTAVAGVVANTMTSLRRYVFRTPLLHTNEACIAIVSDHSHLIQSV